MRGPRARRALLAAALAAALSFAAPGRVARAAEDNVEDVLEMAREWAGMLRDSIPILNRRPGIHTIQAAVDDARRAVAEIDRLSANAAIFQAAPADRQKLQDIAAMAHLNLALFETHGLEFDRAKQEIARARALSDLVESRDFRTEWVSIQTGQPGSALLTRYNLLTLAEFEGALGSIWYRARPVPIEFRGVTTQDLSQVRLVPASVPPNDSLEERLLARGTTLLGQALGHGQMSFTVPLPPGLYRLLGRPGGDIDRSFMVPEATDVDTVLIDRARFGLRIDPKPGPRGPRFFLNGIEVTNLASIPYGVYRLKADPDDYPAAPQIVRFVLGDGIPDKTRSSWTIYVPAGSTAVLALDRGPGSPKRR
jgi:hypothetical protein